MSNEVEPLEPIKTVRPRYTWQRADENGAVYRGERSTIKLLKSTSAQDTPSQDLVLEQLYDGDRGFASFFLQRINVGFSEKSQITQTLGGSEVVYYFDKSPTVVSISGLLFDDVLNGWFIDFMHAYTNYLRGTKLAERRELAEINLPSCKIIGSFMNFNYNQDSARDTDIPFTCQILAHRIIYKPFVKDGVLQSSGYAKPLSEESELDFTLTQEQINEIKRAEQPTLTTQDRRYSNSTGYSGSGDDSNLEFLEGLADDIAVFSGDLADFLDAQFRPANQLLGTIRDYTEAALGVVRAVETGFQEVINVRERLLYNADRVEQLIQGASGIITALPDTIDSRLSRLIHDGVHTSTSAILNGSAPASETAAILGSRLNRDGSESATLENNDEIELESGASL